MPKFQLGPVLRPPPDNVKGGVKYMKDLPLDAKQGDMWGVQHTDSGVSYLFVWTGFTWRVNDVREKWDGGYRRGNRTYWVPENALLTHLRLEMDTNGNGDVAYRGLKYGYRELVGDALKLADVEGEATITAPEHDGGSAPYSLPKQCVVTALRFDGLDTLRIWYREIKGPEGFTLGEPEPGPTAKEAPSSGGGAEAVVDGGTFTGFQLLKDNPDGQMSILTKQRRF